MSYIWSIARRFLFATDANGRPALIPYLGMLGIALGVMVLIVVNAIYAGYGDTIQKRLLASTGHILVRGTSGVVSDWAEATTIIENAIDDKTSLRVDPTIQRQVLLRRTQGKPTAAIVVNDCDLSDPLSALFCDVPVDANTDVQQRPAGKDQGAQLNAYHPTTVVERYSLGPEALAALERGELVLGRRLAETLGVMVGDDLRLVAPPPDAASVDPGRNAAVSVVLRIGALVDFGLYLADAGWAILSFEQAAEILQMHEASDRLEVFFSDLEAVERLGPLIQGELGAQHLVYNMKAQIARQTAYIQQEQQLIAIVVGMTLLVASVGIVSGLVMLVHDKRKEIAVIRTMGARQRDIMAIFVIAGGGIGLIGLALGVGLGCVIALNADGIRLFLEGVTGTELFPVQHFNVTSLPSKLEWPTVLYTCLFATVLVLMASLYPAWQASRVDPALGVKGV